MGIKAKLCKLAICFSVNSTHSVIWNMDDILVRVLIRHTRNIRVIIRGKMKVMSRSWYTGKKTTWRHVHHISVSSLLSLISSFFSPDYHSSLHSCHWFVRMTATVMKCPACRIRACLPTLPVTSLPAFLSSAVSLSQPLLPCFPIMAAIPPDSHDHHTNKSHSRLIPRPPFDSFLLIINKGRTLHQHVRKKDCQIWIKRHCRWKTAFHRGLRLYANSV